MRLLKYCISIGLLSAMLFACKVGQKYQRPEFDKIDEFYGAEEPVDTLSGEPSNLADIQWRDFFSDSTLIGLIDTALVNNIDMQKAAGHIEIGIQNLKQSKANFYPSVGMSPFQARKDYYSVNYNNYGSNRARRNHGNDIPTSMYTENSVFATTLFASWEIDIWGKFRWQKEAAKASYMKSQEFQKAVQTSLIADISSTYYNMLMIKSQIEVAQKNRELGRRTLHIVKLQFEADETTSLAVRQTESQILRAESLIPRLEKDYRKLENRLNQLLGRYPRPIKIVRSLEDVKVENRYNTGVPLELITNRPDVASAEYQLIVSNAKAGVTQAMRYPSIVLNAGTGLNSFKISSFLDPMGSGFALLSGAILQPIFQNRKLKTNYLKSLAERQMSELDFKEKFILAVTDVSDALITIKKLEEEYDIARQRIEVATSGVQDASLLFQSGFANYLEVISAQEDALRSELAAVDLKRQLFLANIELYRSLGGGWK